MGERSYLSIGDVLALLRDEFPDITISKIRFLESRGLLVPERTPSGYRKFYDHDVERLRWILRQQREHFLPLKVIKGRLEGGGAPQQPESLFDPAESPPPELLTATRSALSAKPVTNGSASSHPSTGGRTGELTPASTRVATMHRGAEAPSSPELGDVRELAASRAAASDQGPAHRHHLAASAEVPEPETSEPPAALRSRPTASLRATPRGGDSGARSGAGEPRIEAGLPAPRATAAAAQPQPDGGTPGGGAAGGPRTSAAPHEHTQAEGAVEETPEAPDSAVAGRPAAGRAEGARTTATAMSALTGANLTTGELAQASGLTVAQVEELESFGLIEGRTVAGVHCYDEEAVVVAGLAASFTRYGIEARHLRIFKHASERQAGLYSQVVMPLLRQRNPDARARANDDLQKMAELGTSIMTCFTRTSLRDLTGG